MAKSKKQTASKKGVTMRFKTLVNGRRSIYLDIYKNGERCYEFLKDAQGKKLVLYPDAPEFKQINDATMRLAQIAQSKAEISLLTDEFVIRDKKQIGKVFLLEWLKTCVDNELKAASQNKKNNINMMQRMYASMQKFAKPTIKLCDVDKQFCLDYIEYLRTAKVMCWTDREGKTTDESLKNRRTLATSSARGYFIAFRKCLDIAYKNGYIAGNPISLLDTDEKIKDEKNRAPIHLLEEELIAFARVECNKDSELNIKQAFMFSCFTGYRYGDIKSLTWNDVVETNGTMKVVKETQKTKAIVSNYINDTARKFLPERGNKKGDELVFDLHYCLSWVEKVLGELAQRAGINKHITFHKSRHSFATFALTRGTTLPEVQKMLGHKNIATTQIYAQVVDERLKEASNAMNINF